MKLKFLFLFVIASSTISLASAQTTEVVSLVERTLLEREQMAWRYQLEKKYEDYSRMLGKDFQGVYEDRVTNKIQEIVRIKNQPLAGIDISNLKVGFPTPEAAVVTSNIRLEIAESAGGPAIDQFRSTTFYIKRGTDWVIVYHSHFPIKE
jgi:hypothetical protein